MSPGTSLAFKKLKTYMKLSCVDLPGTVE